MSQKIKTEVKTKVVVETKIKRCELCFMPMDNGQHPNGVCLLYQSRQKITQAINGGSSLKV
jgi:hypothetical protein